MWPRLTTSSRFSIASRIFSSASHFCSSCSSPVHSLSSRGWQAGVIRQHCDHKSHMRYHHSAASASASASASGSNSTDLCRSGTRPGLVRPWHLWWCRIKPDAPWDPGFHSLGRLPRPPHCSCMSGVHQGNLAHHRLACRVHIILRIVEARLDCPQMQQSCCHNMRVYQRLSMPVGSCSRAPSVTDRGMPAVCSCMQR